MNAAFRPSEETYAKLEALIGHEFRDRSLLERALTHGSAKSPAVASNERMEFLGDAVIALVIGEFLFREFGDLAEGRLTKIRSRIVSRKNLASFARGIGLENFMIVGKMFARPETITDSIVSNAVEALIAAVFCDGGYPAAQAFTLRHFEATARALASSADAMDAKSAVHEWSQKTYGKRPTYRLESRTGPDHSLTFEITMIIDGKEVARATGSSKKAAEEAAAKKVITELGLA